MTTALITGITGQDGSYLAELLLNKGYVVWGVMRRSSTFSTQRIDHIYQDPHESGQRLHLVYGDMVDGMGLARIIADVQPDEVYNLAAQSHVQVSFEQPVYTADVDALGTLRLLEAVRHHAPAAHVYQASTSEIFGTAPPPQNEATPFHPRSPYACAKAYAYWQAVNYREAYGMFISNGILFNHESPRRGETFVTRKITRAAARINAGLQDVLYLGNLDAQRDWGYAGDYVQAIWLMLQQEKADDYVVATGEIHSVRDVLDEAFGYFGLDWREYVRHDDGYERPAEVSALCGDATKARRELGWEPCVGFEQLIREMAASDALLADEEAA